MVFNRNTLYNRSKILYVSLTWLRPFTRRNETNNWSVAQWRQRLLSLLEITQWALALLMEITETHEAKKEGFERPLFHNKKMVSLLHSPL